MMKLFILITIFSFSFNLLASNEERERRLAQEVIAGIFDGEPLFLKTKEGQNFLALYSNTESKPLGAIILLHGRGLHANWHNVIQPVRTILPELGWDTLSLQMPVLQKGATFDDYAKILHESTPRIDKAIEALNKRSLSCTAFNVLIKKVKN